MNFYIGQKVVCVYDGCHRVLKRPVNRFIRKGDVYTVRWVGPFPYTPWLDGPSLRLEGVVRPDDALPEWNDLPFCATRFHPINERKTDISIFTEMLHGARSKEPAH